MNFRILILFLLALTTRALGQETTIINQFSDDGLGENYQLKQSSQYTFVVNYYAPQTSPEDEAAALISNALNVYLDKSYLLSESELTFNSEASKMMSEMSSIVNQGLELFQLNVHFNGFSDQIYDQLKYLSTLEWNETEYELLGDNDTEREEMLRYFIAVEFLELKNRSKDEIASFLKTQKVLTIPDAWLSKMENEDELLETIVYDSENFLSPLEFTLDEPTTSLSLEPTISLPKRYVNELNKKAKKNNKRKKDDFSESVLALLEQNSQQLLAIQQDLVDFKKDNIERDRELKKESNTQVALLQNQIDELKELIYADERMPEALNIYENVSPSEQTIILFDKNSAEISSHYKLELNQVLEVLLKNQNIKIMITGYADKSGDPDFNAYLSKRRADEVKNYLYKKGVASNRMLVNYLGDLGSTSENSKDRRVVVEFINDIGSIDLSAN